MRYRIAKKILLSRHWSKKWQAMRPMYYDEKRDNWVQPSMHDIPDYRFQKALRKFSTYWSRINNRKEV